MTNENQVGSGYPKAIIHVDGDAFFASCEVAKNPKLRGKPVVVGGLRGIAVALTYEAKARGIVRGLPMQKVRELCPEAIILPGDYDLYGLFARRMYAVVRRYSTRVEEYSVDECFAEVCKEPEETARKIKFDLETELGVSFSVGLAPTKVLAKVASKFNKPSGLVCIPRGSEDPYLEKTPVGKLWGVGPATASKLYRQHVLTALDFKNLPEWKVREEFAKPHRTIWLELHGTPVYHVHAEDVEDQKSVAATRTFRPPSSEKSVVIAQFSKNIEEVCRRARERGLAGAYAYCFFKSQDFQYLRFEVPLTHHTNLPTEILETVLPVATRVFRPGILYRATGITLSDVRNLGLEQRDLFGVVARGAERARIFDAVDAIEAKYGPRTVFLGSSALVHSAKSGSASGGKAPSPAWPLELPYLGEVK